MKDRMTIFGVLIFVFLMLAFDAWIFSLAFGAERPPDKTIILNFDDGPRPWALEKLLPVLEKYKVPGSFFLEGWAIKPNREFVKKMHDAGHEIENHSWGHEIFPNLLKQKGKEAVKANINKTADAIFEITGRYPRFFRPPCWVINKEVEEIIAGEGYTVMKLGDPDIDTMDYSDFSKHRPTETLIKRVKYFIAQRERQGLFNHVLVFHELPITAEALKTLIPYFQNQGYKFARLDEMFPQQEEIKPPPKPGEIRAIYLGGNYIFNEKKIAELEKILVTTNANGIVIDFKDSNSLSQEYTINLVKRFKKHGAYTIARIVAFQDAGFARKHPEIAIKTSSGEFWYSGRKVWKRYWLDPASELAQDYNIEVAKRAIDAGFDEIQFDYLRFPTDGNMKDIRFPIFNPTKMSKTEVMAGFFKKMRSELKKYSPNALIGIDVFGEVFLNGSEPGIGQDLASISKYFDVICPMAYPSHYKPGIFGKGDPNLDPYDTYHRTIRRGLFFLGKENSNVIIRPWIQNFSMQNIYGGQYVYYDASKVSAQIKACRDLGVNGFMLWNASNNFTIEVLSAKGGSASGGK